MVGWGQVERIKHLEIEKRHMDVESRQEIIDNIERKDLLIKIQEIMTSLRNVL